MGMSNFLLRCVCVSLTVLAGSARRTVPSLQDLVFMRGVLLGGLNVYE